jgi:hypothetical protein
VTSPKKEVVPAAPNSRRSEAEIEQGLLALAFCSGNGRQAAKRLREHGVLEVSARSLYRWKDKYEAKYEDLRRELLPRIREEAAERHSLMADEEMSLGIKLLKQLDAQRKEIPARDLSTAIRNLDVGQGIHRTKAAELRGETPEAAININLSFNQALESLKAKGARILSQGELEAERARELRRSGPRSP